MMDPQARIRPMLPAPEGAAANMGEQGAPQPAPGVVEEPDQSGLPWWAWAGLFLAGLWVLDRALADRRAGNPDDDGEDEDDGDEED